MTSGQGLPAEPTSNSLLPRGRLLGSTPQRERGKEFGNSEENRDLLNQAYVTARDEYDLQFPPLTQPILTEKAPRETTPVICRQEISENKSSEVCPATKRHTSNTQNRDPNHLRSTPKVQSSPEKAPRETTSVNYRQEISENQSSEICPATARHTSNTPERHPNRLCSNPVVRNSPEMPPAAQLFYAQRVKFLYQKEIVPIQTPSSQTPHTDTRTRYMHPQNSISQLKTATGPRIFRQLIKQLRRQHRQK